MQPISKGRLNRMLKYFEGKSVHVSFEYNNSLGHHNIIKFSGVYDQFTIDTAEFTYDTIYAFKLFFKKELVFELDLPGHSEFHGLGKIRYINSGPSCYLEFNLK
jgi:hypothetical protein